MKKILPLLVLVSIFGRCSTNTDLSRLKTRTVTEYSVKTQLGEIAKDSVIAKYSIGYNEDGTQSYFVGLIGYTSRDTTWTNEHIKKIDNKEFVYNSEGGKLQHVLVTKGDTTFFYLESDLEVPVSYSITKKGRPLESYDNILSIRSKIITSDFDKFDNMSYALIEEEFIPNEFYTKYYNPIELDQRRAEYNRRIIQEIINEYY